jgi:hypothetical protein
MARGRRKRPSKLAEFQQASPFSASMGDEAARYAAQMGQTGRGTPLDPREEALFQLEQERARGGPTRAMEESLDPDTSIELLQQVSANPKLGPAARLREMTSILNRARRQAVGQALDIQSPDIISEAEASPGRMDFPPAVVQGRPPTPRMEFPPAVVSVDPAESLARRRGEMTKAAPRVRSPTMELGGVVPEVSARPSRPAARLQEMTGQLQAGTQKALGQALQIQSPIGGPASTTFAGAKGALTAGAPKPGTEGALDVPDPPGADPRQPPPPPARPQVLGSGSTTTQGQQVSLEEQVLNAEHRLKLSQLHEELHPAQEELQTEESALALAKGGILKEQQARTEDIHAQHETRRMEVQGRIEETETQLAQMREAAASERVNPDHWWATRSSGQRVALGIGMLLSGFAEGFSDGKIKNAVTAMINRQIDRDIKAQQANIAKAAGERRELMGILSILERRAGNINVAEAQTRAMLAQDIANKLGQASMKHFDPISRAKLELSRIAAKKVQMEEEYKARVAMHPRKVVSKTSRWRQVPAGGPGMAVDPKLTGAMQKEAKHIAGLKEGSDALVGLMGSYLQTGAKGRQYLKGLYGKALNVVGFGSEEGAVIAERNLVTGEMVKKIFGGHASDPDRRFLAEVFPKYGDPANVKVRKFRKIQARRASKFAAYGRAMAQLGQSRLAAIYADKTAGIKRETASVIRAFGMSTAVPGARSPKTRPSGPPVNPWKKGGTMR